MANKNGSTLWIIREPAFIPQRFSEVLGQNAVLLGEPVDAVVWLPHAADGAADGVRLPRAGHPARLGVHVRDVHLDGGVVLGRDDAVRRRAAMTSGVESG